MKAIRITRRIESETLHLPELRPFFGKTVEMIVREEKVPALSEEALRDRLRNSILQDESPFEPVAEEDWEALE